MIQLKIDTQIKTYSEDVTWQVVAEEYQKEYADEILLVQVNGKLQELQEKIREGEVQFITARQKPGISAYKRSATLFTQWQVLKMWRKLLWIFPLEKVFL